MNTLLIPAKPAVTLAIRRAYAKRRSVHFRAALNRRPAGERISLQLARSLWLVAGARAASGL